MKIKVTQADIDNGIQGSVMACPIALAVNRYIGFPPAVFADRIDLGRGRWQSLPNEARLFVYVFDNNGHTAPFEFEIEDPP